MQPSQPPSSPDDANAIPTHDQHSLDAVQARLKAETAHVPREILTMADSARASVERAARMLHALVTENYHRGWRDGYFYGLRDGREECNPSPTAVQVTARHILDRHAEALERALAGLIDQPLETLVHVYRRPNP